MNEIVLFFAFDAISLTEKKGVIENFAAEIVGLDASEDTKKEIISYFDNGAVVTIGSSGIFVNVPSAKYRDFTATKGIWTNLSELMKRLCLNTLVWTFAKGNRLVFTKQIEEKDKQAILKMVFSPEMLKATGDERVYAEESIDKKRTFICRYGYETFNDKTALSLKTMITVQSYRPDNLWEEVMETNEQMFDVWNWAVSDELKEMMDK